MRPLSHGEYLSLRRFPALDGLRAVGALMVVQFHNDSTWPWVNGWLGVHIFFVLSGYLITTLMLREEERYGRVSIRDFYLRRIFRIMPVYFVVVAITVAMRVHQGHSATLDGRLPYYLTFMNELSPTGILVQTWTIGIEQKFYLVWPLLICSVMLLRRYRMATTAVLTVILVVFMPRPWNYAMVLYGVLLTGCLLAVIMHNERGYAVVKQLTRPWVALVVAVGFIGVHLGLGKIQWTPNQDRWVSLYGIAVAVLLPSLLGRGLPGRILANPVLRFIGDRSYSLYLIQGLAGMVARGLFPADHYGHTLALITALIALAMADLLYRWVEQPMIAVGRRLTGRRAPAAPGQVPATAIPAMAEPGGVDAMGAGTPQVPAPIR
jgi:peptidoglycan/LPS O-acetylase OafA/YrhL